MRNEKLEIGMNDKFICKAGSLTPPGKNVNTRNKRCKQFVGDDARHRPACQALLHISP